MHLSLTSCLRIAFMLCCLAPAAWAQNAGSNITGTRGLIAVDKVGNKIRFYDPVTFKEQVVLESPGPTVHELTVSYDHKTAYVPLYGDGIYGGNDHPNHFVLVIDLDSRKIVRQIDTGELVGPHGLAATRDGKVWATSETLHRIFLIDPARGKVEASYDIGTQGPHEIALLPDESKLYVSSKEDNIAVFDLRARKVVDRIAIERSATKGNGSGTEGLAVSPDGKRLLIFDNGKSELYAIDTATDAVTDRVTMAMNPPTNPKRTRLHRIMYSPDGKKVVALNYAAGLAWILDATDLRKQTPLAVAKGPQGIAFTADSRTALISIHDSGLITTVDLVNERVTGAVDGGAGIEVLAFY